VKIMNQKLLLTAVLSLILSGCATVDAFINTEESAYKIIKQDGDFEIREYPSIIVAETFVSGPLAEATNNGFRAIAGYIFGANIAKKTVAGEAPNEKIAMTVPVTVEAENEKIAMTVPVTVEPNTTAADGTIEANKRWRVHFVMPSKYTLATLPTPKNPAVILRQIPPQRLAAVRFSGFSEEPKVQEQTALLNAWLEKNQVKVIGAPQLARYNPPITLPPLRRNEIMRVVE
jgi:SOUL heme-binding protein